ncbi:MAG: hydroxypyruvate isomerase, partial [Eudoraea sp.]|nr:hydroxypyruvate isomerase [Eudoraea sp.]NNJ39399.1 hydroxypyruvate isomerase [Eudoraea sp.]
MKRRKFIGTSTAATMGLLTLQNAAAGDTIIPQNKIRKGNINHSVCYWCYNSIPLDTFLQNLNTLGIKAIDLVGPEDWPL